MNAPSPLLVLGTGAMACALGARVARAGVAVTLAGSWSEALEAIAARGVHVDEPGGSWSAAVRALPLDARLEPHRFALVLVKSPRTLRAAAALGGCLAHDGVALTLQNGLGNREQLAVSLGAGRVMAGVAFMGATTLGPGEVRCFPGHIAVEKGPAPAGELVDLLRGASLDVRTAEPFAPVQWEKLAANCAVNPLSALHGVPNGALLENPAWRRELEAAAREVAAVASASGVALERDAAAAALEIVRATAGNRSSMLQDLARGARTEIDALCGVVASEGARLGVPTPVNQRLLRLVRQREGRPVASERSAG